MRVDVLAPSPSVEVLADALAAFAEQRRADLEELGRVSSLVEAASIDASEDDVEFKIAALFNAGG